MESRGYFFAPDPSSQMVSSIGGNVATNAGGPHALKYGNVAHHVLGLELVTGAGEVLTLGGAVADRPGYDLAGIAVGLGGTLGVVTKVVVKLTRAAEAVRTAVATFDSIEIASAAVSAIIAEGIVPAALEAMDEPIIRAVEAGVHAGYPTEAKAVLLIELDGPRAEVEVQAEAVARICREMGSSTMRVARDDAERAPLEGAQGSGRRVRAHHAQLRAAGRGGAALEAADRDGADPGDRRPPRARRRQRVPRRGREPPSDDLLRRADPGEFERALEANEEILHACIDLGGTVTGEHGVGLDKAEKLALLFNRGRPRGDARGPPGLRPARAHELPRRCSPSGQHACTPVRLPAGAGKPVPEGMWV